MSDEVGSGHVSIFPVMTGFKGKVARETEQAGAAGAKTFNKGFKGAGTLTGRTLGRELKQSLDSSAAGLGADALKSLNREVAAASGVLSRARLKQQDEAGKVRVAEAKLQEAIAKSGAESSQAVAAEERLAAARRRSASAADAVTAASARLSAGQAAVISATAALAASSTRAQTGLRGVAGSLRDGWKSAAAARSAFTGVMGSLAGIVRAAADITGVTRIARLMASQVSRAFTSMATMVGGGLAKAWVASKSWLGSIGKTVRGAFAPFTQYAAALGTRLASPFVRLGSKVSSWMSPVTSQVGALFSKLGAAAGPAASRLVSSFGRGVSSIGGVASRALSSVTTAASNAGAAAGRALGAGIQNAATGAVGIAAAGIGIALGKGFGRLTAIDTAQAKLRGFGKDAGEIKAIMADASASVKGTAFGLGEAATVAGAAVAAGIKPGEQLQGHLKSIANNASAAGLTMQEMGSIFNKAATQANGVQNDVIGQLADKGIPIYQELGKQLGVTAGDVFDMASRGEIDFETFSKAATAAAGTVADEMGKTVPGATKNFFAAMGRIGANTLGGLEEGSFYSKLGPLINSVSKALGPLEERAKGVGAAWNAWVGPIMDRLTGFFTSVADGSSTVVEKLKGFLPVLAPLAGGFAALGAGGLGGLLARLGPLASLLPGLSGALGLLGGPLGIAAAALGAFALSGGDIGGLVSGLTGVISSVVSALPGLVQQFVTFVPQIVGAILSQVPVLLSAGIEIITVLIDGIVQSIPMLVDGALQLVQGLVSAIITNLPAIIDGAIELVSALVEGLIGALPMLVQGALQLVSGLLTAIISALPTIIEGGVQLLMSLVDGLIQALPQLIIAALELVMGLLTAIIENLPLIIDAGIQLLMSLITGLIDALPLLIEAAITLVLQLVTGLLEALPKLIEAGIQLVIALITGLIEAIPQIVEMIPQIIAAIWDGLAGVDWLDLGAQIIQGLIDGFFSMVDTLGSAVGDIVGTITDFFPHSPAKRGPLSGAGWKRLKDSGKATLRQFNAGAKDGSGEFGASLVEMAKDASAQAQRAMSSVSTTVSASVTGSARPGSTGSESERGGSSEVPMVQQTNNFAHLDPEVASKMAKNDLMAMLRGLL
ncbi:tape measure protein [Microbacterium sp. K24]|uniref:phage tail protein n=1 Tax=Microbacterium sp. K24 TaxID=2305446 RepID=UPI00109D7865|nr:tape measure protein [Microbacterium sp. K24]